MQIYISTVLEDQQVNSLRNQLFKSQKKSKSPQITNLNNSYIQMSSHDNTQSTNEPSKVTGNKEYYTGAAKEKIGQVLGNEKLQAEGTYAKNKGMAEVEAAKTKGQAEGK